MNSLIQEVKIMLVAILALIASALSPTQNALLMLTIFALVNAVLGFHSNSVVKREKFSFRKFFRAIQQLMFYMCLVVILHFAFALFNEVEIAEIAVRVICWVAVWAYLVKILENMLAVFPRSRGFKLLYNIVAIKFIPKLLAQWGIDIGEEDMRQIARETNITITRDKDGGTKHDVEGETTTAERTEKQ